MTATITVSPVEILALTRVLVDVVHRAELAQAIAEENRRD